MSPRPQGAQETARPIRRRPEKRLRPATVNEDRTTDYGLQDHKTTMAKLIDYQDDWEDDDE